MGSRSWLDRLTERFVELQSWTTANKTVLFMLVALGAHTLVAGPIYLGARASEVLDDWVVGRILISGHLVVVALILVGWMEMRRQRDGRWTASAVIIGYGTYLGFAVVQLGFWTTPLLGWALLVTILTVVFYGERAGVIALVCLSLAYVFISVLTVRGVLDYAPALLSRNIDDHATAAFGAFVTSAVTGIFAFTLAVTMLSVRARDLQARRLHAANVELARAHELIRRYVPANVADRLHDADEGGFEVERRKLTVFFSDLQGSTDLSDQLDPEDLATVVNDYFEEMSDCAHAHGTSINHFEGDGILVLFGAPTGGDHRELAISAVQMAFDMHRRIDALRDRWLDQGIRAPVQARMGINTGFASVGDFGSGDRTVYTAIGLQVNAAARIQAQCEPGRVLVSDSTWALVHNDVDTVERGEVLLKGIQRPIVVYEVVDPTSPGSGSVLEGSSDTSDRVG